MQALLAGQFLRILWTFITDLEKAASGASGARQKSRHFEDFLSQISRTFTADGKRRVEDEELR